MQYKLLVKNLLYPLLQLKDGNAGHLSKLRQVRRIYSQSPEEIEKIRLGKLRSLLLHAYENCEYYRNLFDEYSLDVRAATFESLRSLSILTKTDINQNRNRLIASNLANEIMKDSTGGSTTEPMIFFRDPNCWDLRNAYQLYFNELLGWDVGTKWALIWGASKDLSKSRRIKSIIRDKFILRKIQLNAVHMSPAELDIFTREFCKFKPEIVYGYPSAIYQLCFYLNKRGVALDFVNAVICTAEPLNKDQATCIARTFGCDVFNRYTTRECGILAQECEEHRGMHVNYLSVEVQIRDHKIIVTDLDNFGMPLINYQIGDMTGDTDLTYAKCKCGFPGPFIKLDASRDTDFFVLRDGTLVFGAGIPIMDLTGEAGIRNIQIIQKDYDYFLVNIVKARDFSDENIQRIKETLARYVGSNIRIDFNYLNRIDRATTSGKYMYVISELKNRSGAAG